VTDTKLIGLVGGLGPAATVFYYNGLLAEAQRRELALRLMINQADVRLVLDAAARGARDELAAHLAQRLRELERAGAKTLAIAAVTPHMCLPELARLIPAPLVDIVAVVERELRRRKIERIALLGTRATVATRLFGRLSATVVDPTASRIERCHELYLSIVTEGRASTEAARAFGALAAELARELEVEAIVLAGTELSLVPAEAWSGLQTINCAQLHIEAIVSAAAPG
jgi:aspartate racemase